MDSAEIERLSERVSLSTIDFAESRLRALRKHFNDHPLWENIVQHLDDLIAAGQKLKAERAALVTDRDAEKARADKAEGDLKTLQDQVAADEAKAAEAEIDLNAEVAAEAPVVEPPAALIDPVTGLPVAG